MAWCRTLPELASATLHTGADQLHRPIRWVAVIEWPVEHFVSTGDLVLTTGVGCDEAQLVRFVGQLAEAGAAAVCFSTGPGAPHQNVPTAVVAAAAEVAMPLLELPWSIRFSDVSRAIIQSLFTRDQGVNQALLSATGVAGVADALEVVLGGPVLVLDLTLGLLGAGPAGTDWGASPDRLTRLRDCLTGVDALTAQLDADHRLVAAPATVRADILAWVVAILPTADDPAAAELAVAHAGTAVAIELLRDIAADEAEWRARSDFLWTVAAGGITSEHELAARAALLGLPLSLGLNVGVGLLEIQDAATAPSVRDVALRLRRRLVAAGGLVAWRGNELLVGARAAGVDFAMVVEEAASVAAPATLSWGLATGSYTLSTLADAVVQARTARAVTRALHGPGAAGRTDELGAFMLLHSLATDQVAARLAGEVLSPLETADKDHNSDLLGTLEVFLAENGNISSAARRLFLNRHSLIYRLRKITDLTDRDLGSHEDRLLLDISLRLRRLRAEVDR
ncbi:DNA-binding PucR family transcriptional regulator [Actinocrispum wychmicini]|uniref:DNA-binding PucR family transcriptional regulator n=2 Tax=Actinocrispum wychmicini TaxID=1213861 RepID=A0A4V2S620_9PSEU|nr:DNA-binding PucR family transcriptional regulator [Actinocrispum wychmicini]